MGALRFYAYSCATSIMIGSLSCIFTLRSSIQAENGTGPLSVAAYYVSAIMSASVVYPFLLRFLGRKYNLLLGDISFIVSGLTLLLPSREVPIIINAVTGLLSCSVWSAAFAIAVSFASTEMNVTSNDKQSGVKYSGYFVAILSFGQSLVNILPEVTLRRSSVEVIVNVQPNVTADYSCGARDCPNEYSAEGDHPIYNNLVPSRTSLYIFVGVLGFLQIVILVVHFVLLPNDKLNNPEETQLIEPQDEAKNRKLEWCDVACKLLKDSLTTSWRNVISVVSSFTFASQVHFGLVSGFVWLVFTRSFVSCTSGVQQVGFVVLIFYFVSATSSFIVAKCFASIPIRLVAAARLVFDLATCTVAVTWIPKQETIYVQYALAVFFGICQGLSKTLSYTLPVAYFKDIDAGYTLCVCWDAIGVALCGVLSVKMCTEYILYGVILSSLASASSLLIGTCLYGKENV